MFERKNQNLNQVIPRLGAFPSQLQGFADDVVEELGLRRLQDRDPEAG